MKLRLIVSLVLMLFLASMLSLTFGITPVKASGTIVYVDNDNTGFEDGTQAHPYNTIQEGINAASSGDTVKVKAGTYYETITISHKNISLIGEDWRTTIIDGDGGDGSIVVDIGFDMDFNISGFTIRDGHTGIMAYGINNALLPPYEYKVFIIENTIENCDIGLYANYSRGLTIYHNNFRNNTSTFGYFEEPQFNTWDNGQEGNYWDEYTGLDNGSGVGRFGEPRVAGDGVGDTNIPFKPSGACVGVDWYPLMNPWTPPPAVGGFGISLNQLGLLMPHINLTLAVLLAMAATVAFLRYRKKQ